MADTGNRQDPLRGYNFRLEIGNAAHAHFTACTGLGVSIDVIKYREAGNRQIVRKLPGQVDFEPVTLSFGLTNSQEIFQWLLSGVEGRPDRRNVSIVVLDSQGTTDVVRFNLGDAWVALWSGVNLDSLSTNVAIESVTIVYETLQRPQ